MSQGVTVGTMPSYRQVPRLCWVQRLASFRRQEQAARLAFDGRRDSAHVKRVHHAAGAGPRSQSEQVPCRARYLEVEAILGHARMQAVAGVEQPDGSELGLTRGRRRADDSRPR